MKILGVIVTYNPNLNRLDENLYSIFKQVDKVLVIDNASQNSLGVWGGLSKYPNVELFEFNENHGVAYALKCAMEFAENENYDFVLTLDQDSVAHSSLIDIYRKYANKSEYQDTCIFTCNIVDRNFWIQEMNKQEICSVNECITAGMFMKVSLYKKLDGYDEKMFIDNVDFDICYQALEKNYKIMKINFDGILHEVGNGRNVYLFGIAMVSYNEPPFRQYYMARNNFYMSKKHKKFFPYWHAVAREIKFWAIIILFETSKIKKLKKRVEGILDYRKMKVS